MIRYRELPGSPNARHITRAIVLAHLRSSDNGDDDPYAACPENKRLTNIERAQSVASQDTESASDDTSLEHALITLKALYQEESSKIDWSSEHERPSPIYIPHGQRHRVPDTRILKRIAEGRGPRDPQYDDLIGPLRLTGENGVSTYESLSSTEETYEELLQVLLAWNSNVAQISDLTKERWELLNALRARNDLIDDAADQNTLRLLNQPFPQLHKALLAFRPEIAHFENQNMSDIMVMMVASTRVAFPDIDDDLKYAIFETLFKEAIARMLFDKSFRARKGDFRLEQKQARDRGDWDEVRALKEKEREVERQYKAQRASQIIDATKLARRNLYDRSLLQMLELAIVQTAQMEAAAEMRSPHIISTAIKQSSKGIDVSNLGYIEEARSHNASDIDRMLDLTRDCLHRTKKFAALDVADTVERIRVKQDRMDKPGTASMMIKVVEDVKVIRGISAGVLDRMRQMERGLETVLGAATERYQALDGGLQVMDDVEPGVTQST